MNSNVLNPGSRIDIINGWFGSEAGRYKPATKRKHPGRLNTEPEKVPPVYSEQFERVA